MQRHTLREINEHLAAEYGEDQEAVTDTWPFKLELAGEADGEILYRFVADGEDCYATGSGVFTCFSANGMSVTDVDASWRGGRWMDAHEPVDLGTSRLGDDRVPTALFRREAAQRLAGPASTVLAAEFLVSDQRTIVLFENAGSTFVVVEGIPGRHEVGLTDSWPSRRLRYAVGCLLARGLISET